jgi:hypothetical protein
MVSRLQFARNWESVGTSWAAAGAAKAAQTAQTSNTLFIA